MRKPIDAGNGAAQKEGQHQPPEEPIDLQVVSFQEPASLAVKLGGEVMVLPLGLSMLMLGRTRARKNRN